MNRFTLVLILITLMFVGCMWTSAEYFLLAYDYETIGHGLIPWVSIPASIASAVCAYICGLMVISIIKQINEEEERRKFGGVTKSVHDARQEREAKIQEINARIAEKKRQEEMSNHFIQFPH